MQFHQKIHNVEFLVNMSKVKYINMFSRYFRCLRQDLINYKLRIRFKDVIGFIVLSK